LTLIPHALFCLTSLIAARAIQLDALKERFASVDELLRRPILEDVDYVRLEWKDEVKDKKVFPISSVLFDQLWQRTLVVAGSRKPPKPYALRIGTGGRLNGE